MTPAKRVRKSLTPRLGTWCSRALLSLVVNVLSSACTGPDTSAAPPASRPAIAITVLTSPGCAATDPAVAQVTSVAARLGVDLNLERTVVETAADASRLHFLGSPTILVDHRDLDPSARDRTDFGLGWRTFGTSAVPPEEMVERSLREALTSEGRAIVVEAKGFGWGAVAGLGWGSQLAPVLAQLQSVDGVAQARVDWTGRSFLLILRKPSKAEAAVEAATKILGPSTRRLESKDEREQIQSFVTGAPWLRPGETARMSAHEADVLATRYVTDAARSAGLDDPRTARLIALAREELTSLFERLEQTGLPSRDVMSKEWGALVDRVADRSRDFLTESEAERVFEAIRKCCTK